MRCGNGTTDRRVRALVGVLTDEKRIRSEPREGYFEDKVDKASENTLLGLLFRGYDLAMHDRRNARDMYSREMTSVAI